jgi:ATP phosphoribosyltransferase regulatory subunit
MPSWLLPENIADVLPAGAERVERLRRECLDLFRSWGYELVIPPLIEHIESLLIGSGRELAGRTAQLVDQSSGRILGVRADMTPQVARIDAHLLGAQGMTRLCYAGSVLHARAAGLFASREPLQMGAELYGHGGVAADLEIIGLMVESLALAGVHELRIDLCHMGVVPALLAAFPEALVRFGLDEDDIYALLVAKDKPALAALRERDPVMGKALLELAGLYGPVRPGARAYEVLEQARLALPDLAAVRGALDTLEQIVRAPVWQRYPGLELSIDLADVRGYRYHNGVSFAAFMRSRADAIARGGRYDGVGAVFGRSRPATGFSLELRELAGLSDPGEPTAAILAPSVDDGALESRIAELRAAGEIVIRCMADQRPTPAWFNCDRALVQVGQQWLVQPVNRAS